MSLTLDHVDSSRQTATRTPSSGQRPLRRSWEQLADLNAQQSVAVIDETAAALATIPGGADLNTVNQVFMVCA